MNNLFKEERIKRGFSISEVAKITGIPEEFIEAIENGTLDTRVDPYYVRKYTELYRSFLKVEEGSKMTSEGEKNKVNMVDFLFVFLYAIFIFYSGQVKDAGKPVDIFLKNITRRYAVYGNGWVSVYDRGRIFEGFIKNNLCIISAESEHIVFDSDVVIKEIE